MSHELGKQVLLNVFRGVGPAVACDRAVTAAKTRNVKSGAYHQILRSKRRGFPRRKRSLLGRTRSPPCLVCCLASLHGRSKDRHRACMHVGGFISE